MIEIFRMVVTDDSWTTTKLNREVCYDKTTPSRLYWRPTSSGKTDAMQTQSLNIDGVRPGGTHQATALDLWSAPDMLAGKRSINQCQSKDPPSCAICEVLAQGVPDGEVELVLPEVPATANTATHVRSSPAANHARLEQRPTTTN